MSYVVIARKYRPRDFTEIIGQESVQTTLRNAIALNRIAHAYLFAGPRGVGKTSMARIFAKSLNCKDGPTPDPCGKCPSCSEIDGGRSLDVVEIDGASNRGIDDVRAIRENIKFSPAYGRYKIYIIDEVHQITGDGFNALLKTLEEPPAHAKFIFATTAPNKLPATVLSRCQRFDFKRIPTKTIASHLSAIAKSEKIKIREDALLEIAKAGDGSLRDAESILDQLSSFSKGEIGYRDVAEALGAMNPEEFLKLFDSIASRDAAAVLDAVEQVVQSGREPGVFVEKCMEHVRNLMVLKVSPKLISLVEGSDSYCERLSEQAARFSREDLFYAFSVLMGAGQNLRRFALKRAPLEMALLKCTLREPAVAVREAEEALKGSQAKGAPPPLPAAAEHRPVVKKNSVNDAGGAEMPAAAAEGAAAPAVPPAGEDLEHVWQQLVRRIRTEKMSAASFLQEGRPVEIRGDAVIVGFRPECSFNVETLGSETNKQLLDRHLSDILNRKARIEFMLEGGRAAASDDDPVLKSALGIFGGRVVKS